MRHGRSTRTGRTIESPEGYILFEPAPLPPPDLEVEALQEPLARAMLWIGRLDAVGELLPAPDIFLTMYVRKEAVLSAQIEGTQASLTDVLNSEAGIESGHDDVGDILNYIRAMNGGMEALRERQAEGRALFDQAFLGWLHRTVIEDTRGDGLHAGAYRVVQNWIAGSGRTSADALSAAVFVPPAPAAVPGLMENLNEFMNAGGPEPALLRAGIAHAQFETIHPFIDGNGRVGRLLVTLMLCASGILRRPLLYLSAFLKTNRTEYYDRLSAVRMDGDWEGWLRFFLLGVASAAEEGFQTALRVRDVLQEDGAAVDRELGRRTYPRPTLELLSRYPRVSPGFLADRLQCVLTTATATLQELEALGVVREVTGRERGRVYEYTRYLAALHPEEIAG